MSVTIESNPWREILRRPSVMFLIAVNLLPLLGVILFGWNVGFLMLLYWIETVVIGLFNIPKILTSRSGKTGGWGFALAGNLFLTAFFIVHYGMFNFGHVVFLNSLFELPPIGADIVLTAGGLSLSHVFSLIVNWFGKGEYVQAIPNEQMFKPYGRIVIMHVAILIGGLFAMFGGGVVPLALLIALKTGSDIMAHAVSHRWITLDARPNRNKA